jgi:hypothetical protein
LYTIALAPQSEAHATSPAVSPATVSPPTSLPPSARGHDEAHRSTKPLSPWVFYVGAGGSLLLGGLTAWSGMNALNQVDHYKQTRAREDREPALSSVHRTDWLLAGTLALTGVTAYVGLRWVDFGGQERALTIAPQARGASLVCSGKL